MELAGIVISGICAEVLHKKTIPRGIIGATIHICYSDSIWDRLDKTVVFQGGGITKDIVNAGEIVTVPAEVVSKANSLLRVGVYGTDKDGMIAIPTLWADIGLVRYATDPSGDTSTDPTLPVWAQLQSQIDEQGERIADLVVLSDFELEMLNELLLNGTLRCAPEITATYNASNGVDPDTGFAVYFYDVSATIENIDKALIKKVEVGVGTRTGATTMYDWFDTEPSYGDAIHTIAFSGKYLNFSGYFRPAVRLTYYHPLAGEEQILRVEAVKE